MITAVLIAASLATANPPLKARVHVDAGYGHDKELKQVFSEASAILEGAIGTGVEIAEQKPWKPSPAASKNVRAGLSELEREDDGKDVDLVIAFITKAPKDTAEYHQLGNSKPVSKQSIIRAVGDVHEEALILAHHIAHNLGGVHATDASGVLSATYAATQKDKPFNEDQIALMKPGVVHFQAKTEKERSSALAQVTRELEARRKKLDETSAGDLKSAIDELAGSATADLVLPPEQARIMNDAVAAMNAGDEAGAFKKLQPLADKPDAAPQIQALACRLSSSAKVTDPDAARCDKALKVSLDLDTANAAVRAALKKKDDASIKRAFGEAKARLAKVKGGPEVDELAALAQGTGRLSLAEDALAKSAAPNAAELKRVLDVERRRQGVPRGMLSSDDEAAVLADITSIAGLEMANVGEALDAAVKKYGDVPGLYVAKCDWQIKKGRLSDAEKSCEKATAKYPDASMAHVVSGIAYMADNLTKKAIENLEKAIELDPDYPEAYELLAPLYHQTGKRELEGKLGATYEQRFKRPLKGDKAAP